MGSFSRIVLVVLIALAALSTQIDQALAQERIRIAWAGVSPANSPIWVVQERGLLKKHGLNGEVISISASPIALQAFARGGSRCDRNFSHYARPFSPGRCRHRHDFRNGTDFPGSHHFPSERHGSRADKE